MIESSIVVAIYEGLHRYGLPLQGLHLQGVYLQDLRL